MDSISEYEFGEIFDRVTSHVNLQGKLTVHDINMELVKARDRSKRGYIEAETIDERRRYKRAIVEFNNLLSNGFANRAIEEAMNDPNGSVAMTLRFGKLEAKRRLLAQRETRMRIYRRPGYWNRR